MACSDPCVSGVPIECLNYRVVVLGKRTGAFFRTVGIGACLQTLLRSAWLAVSFTKVFWSFGEETSRLPEFVEALSPRLLIEYTL